MKWNHCGIEFYGYKVIEDFFILCPFKWTLLKNQMSLMRRVPSQKCFPLKTTISFVLNNLISHEHLPVYFQWSHIHFKKRWLKGWWAEPQISKQQSPCSHPWPISFGLTTFLSWEVKHTPPSPAPRDAKLPANDLDASDTRRGAERELKVPSLWALVKLIYISQFPIILDSHSPSVSP